ncbi:MAG: hypothetical protein AAGL96_13095, partial [Pseudomonadota bacterium]
MAALAGGGYVAVWQSQNQNGTGDGLTAQLFNDVGQRVGLPFFIESNTVSTQTIGGVAATSDGGFVVTWKGVGFADIIARKFDSTGAPETDEFQVNTETYSTQNQPEVTGLTGGGYVVTWSSFNDETFTFDIRAQRYDANNMPVGAEFTVNTTTASTQQNSEVASLSDGGFVVVWQDDSGADGSSSGVFGQRYDAAGVAQGGEFQINSTTAGSQLEADVVGLNGGGFVAVWTDYNGSDGNAGGVYAQIYDATGATVGGEFLVNQTTNSWQWQPAVAATADGGFFVSWYGYGTQLGVTFDIVGRHFDANGVAQGDEVIINQDGTGTDPQRPDVIALSNGAIVTGWDYPAANGDGSGRAVYQALFELPGSNITIPEPPIVEAFDPTVTFTETQLQSGPQILDASGAVAVSGPADFDGGRVTVTRINAQSDFIVQSTVSGATEDILGIRDQGTGVGEIGVSGTSVTFGGIVIGTVTSDGANGAPLEITLNMNADRQAVEALLENITYENPSNDPIEDVQLAILLEDGDGGASSPVQVNITVIPETDAPGPVFDSDIQVNSFTNSTQFQPAIAALDDGGWVVMWESFGQDNPFVNDYGIIGQRYDESGIPVSGEFLVNTQVSGSQSQVDVAAISGGPNVGGFVATWYDPGDSGLLYVKAQVFDANSQPVGGEISVPTTSISTNQFPSVATFADGSFVIAWASWQGTNGYDIAFQTFDASGTPTGTEIIANSLVTNEQTLPEVVVLADGNIALTWRTFDASGSNTQDIATRVFQPDGTPVSAEILVNSSTAGNQTNPDIAALDGGGYVVVWQDQIGLDGSSFGVFAQVLDASGSPVGGEFLVNEETSSQQGEPVVSALPGGGFAISYYTIASAFGGTYEVVVQNYDGAGNRIDSEIVVNQDTAGNQYEPAIATLASGDLVVAFRDDSGRDGDAQGIFQQIVGNPNNFTGAQNSPNVTIAQQSVTLAEADVNAAPQLLFTGVDVGDPDSADFDGGVLRIFQNFVAADVSLFGPPDGDTQDTLGIQNQGTGPGQIGVAGTDVTFGGVVIGTITSDGVDGADLIVELNANSSPDAVEAFLQAVTYANASDDPAAGRTFTVTLTDGDGGSADPVNVQVTITEDAEGISAISGETQVNSFEDGAQSSPEIGALASGGYVSVWVSYDQDAGTFDNGIYAQRFDAYGQAIGSEIAVNTQANGNQNDPVVAGLGAPAGGYAVVWYDTTNTAGFIKAVVFNDDGTVRTPEFQVETSVFSTRDTPAIAATPNGFLVTWSSFNSGSGWDIMGQYFDANGAAIGTEFLIGTGTGTTTQYNSDVAVDAAGNVVVVWEDQSARDGSAYAVYGQRIDASGTLVGPDFQVNTNTTSFQYNAKVAYLTNGNFVVTWQDDSGIDGSGSATLAQVFDASGNPIGGEFLVNKQTTSTQANPDITALSNGGFAISFEDSSGADGSGTGVFLQEYNPDGSRRDGPVQINDEISSTQFQAHIVEVTDGTGTGVAGVWTSTNSSTAGDGSGNGVFTRVFAQPGALTPGNTVPDVENLDLFVDYAVASIGTPMLLDNAVDVSDADSADFDGGTVEIEHLSYRSNADDQLGVLNGKGITVVGSDVQYDGTLIGTIDATDNGVNGANLVINLNANATAANVRYLIEQLSYASSNPVSGSERVVSVRVTDGDGGISEGDSIRIDIESSVGSNVNQLNGLDSLSATESQVEAGLRLDDAVDYDYTRADGFLNGSVTLGFRNGITNRSTPEFETLTVGDFGTGTNQIGVSGNDITFEGTVIGTIDVTLDGANGSDLRINLNANASQVSVDALIEAFTYTNTSDGPPDIVRFDVNVRDAVGNSTGDRDFDLAITSETDGTTVALGGEMQVNAFTIGAQRNAAVTELSDGGFVVTWESNNQDSSSGFDSGIYQQRYSSAGEPVGPEILVNQNTAGQQDMADVAGLTGGGWVVVWEGPGSTGQDVLGRIFDANGVGGAEFQINTDTGSSQYNPSVTELYNGNFVVTWDSETSGAAGDGSGRGVQARVYQADGTPISTSDIDVNTFTSSAQDDTDVAGLVGGGFVVVWETNGADGSGDGIAFQRYDDAGVPQGSETIVNTTTAGAQDNPAIAELTDGGFVVVWQAPDASGDGVYLQRFDSTGNPVGGEVLVNDWQGSTAARPDVTGTNDGGWVVTFDDNSGRDGNGAGILAQRYDASGARVDGNFVVNDEILSTQDFPDIATLSDGRIVVAWDSATSGTAGDGSFEGVFVRLFGTTSQTSSDDPEIGGLADVTIDEAVLNAGFVQVFSNGTIAVTDTDSSDFDGGRLMVHAVRDYAAAQLFQSPDDFDQDVFTFSGTGISLAGGTVSVGGTVIGTLEQDGQSGNGLQVLLNANATPELVEDLLGSLNYRNPSDDPQDTRTIEVTLSDGDGGVTQHQTITVNITPEQDGFERVGDETQVNSFTVGAQDTSDVAGLTGGGHVVVWASTNQDNPGEGLDGVFAQIFDANGQPIGPEFQVNTTFAGTQTNPSAVGLSDGTWVVAWQGSGPGDTSGVFGQRYAADGTPLGDEFRLNDGTGGSETDVQLAATATGFVATFYDSTPDDVQARIFDNAGNPIAVEFTVNDVATGNQTEGEVDVLANGNIAFTWYNSTTDNVFVRIFDGTGTALTGDIDVTSVQPLNQDNPDIAALAGGGFVVAWVDDGGSDGSGVGVFAQIFNDLGVATSPIFLINDSVSSTQNQVQVVGTPDGGFTAVFSNSNGADGSGSGVFAQQFDANGNRIDDALQVNTEFSSTQNQPAASVLANGAVVVSYTSATSSTAGDGNSNGVFAQILGNPADFDLDGRPVLQGLNSEITLLEADINLGPALIDANNAVALSDDDSTDFDGGFLRVDNVIASRGFQNQVSPPDDLTQDNISLRQAQGISISGSDVLVGTTVVGTIISDGQAGERFEIALNANANVANVELLVENLTYFNPSDDPELSRVVRVQVGDGDGGVSDPALVTINITPDVDGIVAGPNGEQQANTETLSTQSNSDVTYLTDGGFVIVWQSFGQDATSTWGVYGQRYDDLGNAVGSEFQVNTTTTSSQYEPAVSGLDTGGWVVTWRDDSGLDGSGTGIFMQRYNSDGSTAGSETQVNTYFSSTQYEPDVTVLANGDYIVTWSSFGNTSGGGNGWDVWAQLYQSDGTAIGTEFLVNTTVANTQDAPDITALANGGFAIAWEGVDASGRGVYLQTYGDSTTSYASIG